MSDIVILCLEDESEVREAILRDLEPYATTFTIEAAEDADDARQVVDDCLAEGKRIGLALCDHLLPGQTGVDFLVELGNREETRGVRKVLVTGQAGLEDTIKAVNQANLHHYISKPWNADQFREVVRQQLVAYVIAEEENLLPYVQILNDERLLEALRERGFGSE